MFCHNWSVLTFEKCAFHLLSWIIVILCLSASMLRIVHKPDAEMYISNREHLVDNLCR